MLEIRLVDLQAILELRHMVLRPHQSIEDCLYPSDGEISTFHLGAFLDGKLISTVSFNQENCEIFSDEVPETLADKSIGDLLLGISDQYRLRAMATLPEFQKMGVGRQVVAFGENILKQRGVNFLWCKGRVNVQAYYTRLGFKPYGEPFDYPPIGMHIVLTKTL